MTVEDLESIEVFLRNHKAEIPTDLYRLARDAGLQMQYWFLDGQPEEGYDPGFYKRVLGLVCFKFVKSRDDGWYDHPKDFPDYYERMLFN